MVAVGTTRIKYSPGLSHGHVPRSSAVQAAQSNATRPGQPCPCQSTMLRRAGAHLSAALTLRCAARTWARSNSREDLAERSSCSSRPASTTCARTSGGSASTFSTPQRSTVDQLHLLAAGGKCGRVRASAHPLITAGLDRLNVRNVPLCQLLRRRVLLRPLFGLPCRDELGVLLRAPRDTKSTHQLMQNRQDGMLFRGPGGVRRGSARGGPRGGGGRGRAGDRDLGVEGLDGCVPRGQLRLCGLHRCGGWDGRSGDHGRVCRQCVRPGDTGGRCGAQDVGRQHRVGHRQSQQRLLR